MTAAPYTFTLSAAQSSATSMVVAMRAKTGSSIPGTAARWQGGVMPQATLNFAAGVTTATVTVNTAPNTTVDGNAEYEWYKVSSTPSDLSLDTSSLPTVTVVDDDTSGGGTTLTYVYGPQDTSASSGVLDLGSNKQQVGRQFSSGSTQFEAFIGVKGAGGNGETGLFFYLVDGSGFLQYFPVINTQNKDTRAVNVNYTGAAPSLSEPHTYLRINDDLSINYCCATTAPTASKPKGDNERILVAISSSVWSDTALWTDAATYANLPGKAARVSPSNSRLEKAMYAARIGAVQ